MAPAPKKQYIVSKIVPNTNQTTPPTKKLSKIVPLPIIERRRKEEKMTSTKSCSSCGIDKPTSDFGKQSSTKDKLTYECKACIKKKRQAFYLDNKEKIIPRVRRWQKKNPSILPLHQLAFAASPYGEIRRRIATNLRLLLSTNENVRAFSCQKKEIFDYISSILPPDMNWEDYLKEWDLKIHQNSNGANLSIQSFYPAPINKV